MRKDLDGENLKVEEEGEEEDLAEEFGNLMHGIEAATDIFLLS